MNMKKRGSEMAVTMGLFLLILGVCFPLGFAWGLDPSLLDGQWFRAKGSMKGYAMDMDRNIVGTVSGGATFYMRMNYHGGDEGAFTVMTCAEDDDHPGVWHGRTSDPIPLEQIYGTHLEIWDFQGTPIEIYDGYAMWLVYPSLFVKVTTDGPTLKKATLKTISCGIWGQMGEGNVLGSCKLSGSSTTWDKVPPGCRDK